MKKVNHLNSVLIEGNVVGVIKECVKDIWYAKIYIATDINDKTEEFLITVKDKLAEVILHRIKLFERIRIVGSLRNNQNNIYISANHIEYAGLRSDKNGRS